MSEEDDKKAKEKVKEEEIIAKRYDETSGLLKSTSSGPSGLTENKTIRTDEIEAHSDNDDNYFLVDLNKAITKLIRNDEILKDDKIDIWYDLPEDESRTPDGPTICIYLYDVKEKASARTGESGNRGYTRTPQNTVELFRGFFNVQCSYLIIFWDKTSQQLLPNNQNAIIASRIVTALLNTYHLDKIPEFDRFIDYDARFIQNSEQMNSISNFWQSLKQRPRLCLSYEVTVPIQIPEAANVTAPSAISIQTLETYVTTDGNVNTNIDIYVKNSEYKGGTDSTHPEFIKLKGAKTPDETSTKKFKS